MEQNLRIVRRIFEDKNIIKRIFVVFVALCFVSDFLTKISITYGDSSFSRLAGVIKLIFEFLMIILLLKKKKITQGLVLGGILVFAFLISNINEVLASPTPINHNTLIQNVYYANRYLYIFIFIAFLKLYEVEFSVKDSFIELFKLVLNINSIIIIIAFLFKIELFRSFPFSLRFGYDGVFSKNGEAAYYYMFFISILYNEYFLDKKVKSLMKVIAISIVSLLLGKKIILLFLFLLLVGHIAFVLRKTKELGLGLLIVMMGLGFYREVITATIFKISPFWEGVYQNYGLIGTLTSIRSKLFVDFIEHASANWNAVNYFFGTGEYEKYKVEFEFVDVFLFFGITGIIVFIYLLKKYFYNKTSMISRCLFLCILISSFFSGALFISVTSMIFFYVVFQCINSKEYT